MNNLTPVPDDSALAGFLADRISQDSELCEQYLGELAETISDAEVGEPLEFAYGKMLNKFYDMDHSKLVTLCAAAMWRLHGQENAVVTAIRTETDSDAGTQVDNPSRSGD